MMTKVVQAAAAALSFVDGLCLSNNPDFERQRVALKGYLIEALREAGRQDLVAAALDGTPLPRQDGASARDAEGSEASPKDQSPETARSASADAPFARVSL